jgi:DNA-binding SARP family transcriptional activator
LLTLRGGGRTAGVMEFRILGPLEVLADGHGVDLGGRKQRALLALLLFEANRSVSRERLIDALWEDEPTATAAKALQVYVSQLRKLLGKERLSTQPTGYLLRVDPGELDLERFIRLRDAGKLRDALALWRGPPVAEFGRARFARAEIARLEEFRLGCLEERLEADLTEGRHAEVVGELEALVREHPLRERLRVLLLLALYRSGRQAEALAAYQGARHMLVNELGIEPGKALRELQQAILRQDPSLEPSDAGEQPSERGVFVGRDSELAQLFDGLEDAIAGRGRLFLLVGEPGIGKSRLAEEAIRRARARGCQVLVGRCWEASGAPAYWPWVQSLRSYIREAEPERLRAELGAGAGEVAQILPELRTILPELPEPAALESESARFSLFDATAELLRNASRHRPLLFFLDDMHAADAPSLLLLQFLARELVTTRMLVIAACRDVDPVPGRPLASMLAEVAREPGTTRLSLRGLSAENVAEYVELVAGELASPELVAALYEETEGHPLFLSETVRLLAVEGRIAIPESVRDVISRRLGHLGAECNRVLTLASVLGREFALDALARMADVGEDELLETLDEAAAAGIASDVQGAAGHLRFAHMLIRDTLYEGLTTPRRIRLHRLAIEALEGVYGDESGAHLAELAHHAAAGSDFEKAVVCAQRAADRALGLLAFEEAARLYRVALEALNLARPDDETTRCDLLISLGEAQARAGNSAVAKETSLAAAEIARRLGLSHQLARAAAEYGDGGRIVWARAGDDERLVPLLEEGLAAVGSDVELRARLLARLAGALRDEHARDRRDALSREAVELARSAGNPVTLGYALVGRAHAITAPDTIADYLALADELCEVAAQIGDKERIVAGHMLRIMGRHLLGDLAGAEADLNAASAIAHELRQPSHLWEVGGIRAMLALAEGRFAEAESLIDEALALGESAMPEAAITHYRMQRLMLCEFRGGLEEVEPWIAALLVGQPARSVFACALAYVHARLGRTSEAQRALKELAHDEVAALPFDQEWLLGASLLAETCALVADARSAEILHRSLLPWEALNAVDQSEGARGSVSRYLGLLATMLERWEEAARHFGHALAMNERMGFRPWFARTHDDFARMLRLRGEPRDEKRAAALEAAALAIYDELGATPT